MKCTQPTKKPPKTYVHTHSWLDCGHIFSPLVYYVVKRWFKLAKWLFNKLAHIEMMAQETKYWQNSQAAFEKTNPNRKAMDGILQWSSLWFTLGLRRWSLWGNRTHINPCHRQGNAVAERRLVNISTGLWRLKRGKDLALGFLFYFQIFLFSRQLAAGTNEKVELGGKIFNFATHKKSVHEDGQISVAAPGPI